MKSTTHDALLSLLLHQQGRLLDASLGGIALPRLHMETLSVARKMAAEGIKVTPEALSLHPEGGEKIATLAAALITRNPPDAPMALLIEAIRKENLRANITAICRKYHDKANEEDTNPGDALLDLHGEIARLTSERTSNKFEHGSNMQGIEERLSWRQQHTGMLRGPSSGIRSLDLRLNGITPRYYILGARPSVGKSALLGNIIEAFCQEGKRVLLFSWEMPADDCRERQISSLSGVNLSSYGDRPLTMEELNKINAAQRVMKQWNWYINDDPDSTIDDIEAQSMCLHREEKIDLIGIDYLQLIRMNHRMKRFEHVSEISNRLMRLRRRLGTTAIMALSQLRRVEGRYVKEADRTMVPKPELQDLRESGDLEQDADVVALLHRDNRYEPTQAELIIAKQRGGPTGEPIPLEFVSGITKFKQSKVPF